MLNINYLTKIKNIKTNIPPVKKILFSEKDDWNPLIIKHIDTTKYIGSFYEIELVRDYQKYDLIIPLSIQDQIHLNKKRQGNEKNTFCPSDHIMLLANNKDDFNQFLVNNNLSKYIPRKPKYGEYPYILKAKVGEFGKDCYIIKDEIDEEKFKNYIKDTKRFYKQILIKENTEYTTHIFYYKKIQFHCTYEFSYSTDCFIKGHNCEGISSKITKTPFLKIWGKILGLLNYEGMCCFNYKIFNGTPYIFEMNPRYGASLLPHINEVAKIQLKMLKKNQ